MVLLAASCVALAQETKPAVEYRSILNIPFAEANGNFQINQLQIVFPSPHSDHATLSISKASGEEIASVPLHLESYLRFPIFGSFVPDAPQSIRIGEPGDFVLTIKVTDEVITRFPFTLVSEANADPYGPPRGFLRDGPWRDLAYLSLPATGGNSNMKFNWWMSLRELPVGMTDPAVTIRLMQGYKEVARSSEELRLRELDWQCFSTELVKTKPKDKGRLTLNELVGHDASYLLIVEADHVPIKSYQLEVRGGRVQRAEQSRIDFEPHADFISPRFAEASASATASEYSVTDAYWLRRTGIRRSFAPLALNRETNQQISKKEQLSETPR
jgi:hypothetical protein